MTLDGGAAVQYTGRYGGGCQAQYQEACMFMQASRDVFTRLHDAAERAGGSDDAAGPSSYADPRNDDDDAWDHVP